MAEGMAHTAVPFTVPDVLLTPALDFSPLKNILQQLGRKIEGLEDEVRQCRAENVELKAEVQHCACKYEISEAQFTALFETVTSCREAVDGMQSQFISREETEKRVALLDDGLAKLRRSLDDVDSRKVDQQSPWLDGRIKDQSEDCCNRFLLRREREQREWVQMHLSAMDNKTSQSVETLRTAVTERLDSESVQVANKIEALSEALRQAEKCTAQESLFHTNVEKALVTKIDGCELALENAEDRSQTEVDRVELQLKRLAKLFGIEWVELQETLANVFGASPENSMGCVVIEEDFESVNVIHERERCRALRSAEAVAGWKAVRLAAPKLLNHVARISQLLSGGGEQTGSVDPRAQERIRDEKLRAIRRRLEASRSLHSANQPHTSARNALASVLKYLMQCTLFADLRASANEWARGEVGRVREDMSSDFAGQVQELQRDLRGKVSAARAVELIEEYAAKKVREENAGLIQRFECLQDSTVTRDELASKLFSKANVSHVELKADTQQVVDMEATLRSSLSDSIGALQIQMTAMVDGKVKDLQREKLDKDDEQLLKLIEAMSQGFESRQPTAWTTGSDGKCLSCHRPTTPRTPRPGRTPQPKPEEDLQALQEALHAKQMQQRPRSGRKGSVPGEKGFSLKAWADEVDATYNEGAHRHLKVDSDALGIAALPLHPSPHVAHPPHS